MVYKAVHLLRAQEEGGCNLARVDTLTAAVDHALLDKAQHSVGKHLRMDAEVAVSVQLRSERVGQRADTHLNTCAVVDERRTLLADKLFLLCRLHKALGDKRRIVSYEVIKLIQTHQVAVGERDIRIDDCYRDACRLDGGDGAIDRGPQ